MAFKLPVDYPMITQSIIEELRFNWSTSSRDNRYLDCMHVTKGTALTLDSPLTIAQAKCLNFIKTDLKSFMLITCFTLNHRFHGEINSTAIDSAK